MMHYFIFAGEISGDLHGSRLIQTLRNEWPHLQISGVGGPAMRKSNFNCLMRMEEFQVMGFSDVIRSLPKLIKQFYIVRRAILNLQPEVVILIDYPGFNLRLARELRKQGFRGKIIQYICPTVWAHGKKRIQFMAKYLDLVLSIFPFEAAYFSHTSLPVKYIGNPIAEMIQQHIYDDLWFEKVGLCPSKPIIALFPGSRIHEIKRHLPQQLQAFHLLKKRDPSIQGALSYAHEDLLPYIRTIIENEPFYFVPQKWRYELMQASQTALAKSGTVTLELALHRCPTVVMYQLSKFNYYMAKYVLKLNLPYYSLPSILAGQAIFPEVIGTDVTAEALLPPLEKVHGDADCRAKQLAGCDQVRQNLEIRTSITAITQAIQELFI